MAAASVAGASSTGFKSSVDASEPRGSEAGASSATGTSVEAASPVESSLKGSVLGASTN